MRITILGTLLGAGLSLALAGPSAPVSAAQLELPRDVEIELATSALPEHLRGDATVYAWDPSRGFVTVREGDNGFHALVARTEPAVFRADWDYDAHAADVLLPIGFDAVGAAGPLRPFLDAARLQAEGLSPRELKREMAGRFERGEYPPATGAGVAYMLAPILRGYPAPLTSPRLVTRSVPHWMFYAPGVSNDAIGANPAAGGPFIIQPGEHGYIGMRATASEMQATQEAHRDMLDRLCSIRSTLCLEADEPAPGLDAAVEAALTMPRAIDHVDWETFRNLFTEDAVMWFPFRQERADGREALLAVMEPIFERNRARLPGPIFGFEPENVVAQPLGDDSAVVTWTMETERSVSRRTAVVRRVDGAWKVSLVHADTWPKG